MADVFISYKREERRRADAIASRLRALGLEVWLDAQIDSGKSFDVEIETALKAAKAVLVLWTAGSVASEWVRNEASVAKDRGTLVALMLEPCELPIAFRALQYEPLFEKSFADDHPSWVKVVERIKDLAGKRNQVERESRRRIFRHKRNGILLWLLAWPLGVLGCATVIALFDTSSRVTPQWGRFNAGSWDLGYVTVEGTWELEGKELAAPINHVQITCNREEGYCLEARAKLYKQDNLLAVETDRRPIVSWTPDTITTRNVFECGNYAMTINRESESVAALQVITSPSATIGLVPAPCSGLEPRKDYRLVNFGQREMDLIPKRIAEEKNIAFAIIAFCSAIVGWRIFRILRRRRSA